MTRTFTIYPLLGSHYLSVSGDKSSSAKFNTTSLALTFSLAMVVVSTTVVNPGLWMPQYEESRANAFFFVFFIVTSVFYLHSLILSVVFQAFIQAATNVHHRSASNREEAIRLSFVSLASAQENARHVVETKWIRETLQKTRPHYSPLKVSILALPQFPFLPALTTLKHYP